MICRRTLAAALLGALLAAGPAVGRDLTPEQERGRQIYMTGHSPSGTPIVAYFGEDSVEIPEEASTCSGCHGYDGTGRPESGVIPSNVTWPYLTKSYGHVHSNGVEHPAFTVETLKDYMESGVYPGGGAGDPSMPVYEMASRDLDDLVAFMQLLGQSLDPGVTEGSLRLGTVLPAAGPGAPAGEAVRALLEAYLAEVNEAGGIYGRKVELSVLAAAPGPSAKGRDLAGWVRVEKPFALVATFTPGFEGELYEVVGPEEIPLVGPLTLYPLDAYSL
ncbi:MAG: ABC transporter substrate-binding protein, partial [Deltaproteobacteria bacterium]|nr:ABC transporter substrate-binding protein [Deltaproteobacteria bacterium]